VNWRVDRAAPKFRQPPTRSDIREKHVKAPGPDHPITITPNPNRVRIMFAGRVVADTTRALTLRESTYPPVQYIPREDAVMDLLQRTDHATHCPYKGDAAYYSVAADGKTAANAVWTYEQPFPFVGEIAGHLAFYPNRVDAIEELPR
jgi:uncharacterized protein (DUF427 family)